MSRFHKLVLEDVIAEAAEEVKNDDDDLMILEDIRQKPPIEHCRGYWIEISDWEGTEGLIVGVDMDTRVMIVEYGDILTPIEYEISYDSRDIVKWYRMATGTEQRRSVWAAIKIQSIVRAR